MTNPLWKPDFGPEAPHPSAGVVAIGARAFLIAYNINLATADLAVAERIAKAIRHLSGGFRYVKAMGVPLAERGIVQVSINMTNFRKTPLHRVFDRRVFREILNRPDDRRRQPREALLQDVIGRALFQPLDRQFLAERA